LLAALADEAESRAAELMAQFGLEPPRVLEALGLEAFPPAAGSGTGQPEQAAEQSDGPTKMPYSPALRALLLEARMQARAIDRAGDVGTEHLLACLIAGSSPDALRMMAAGLELEPLRKFLAGAVEAASAPMPPLEGFLPLDLSDPVRAVDLARIVDASANRAREGLRVVEDFVRFVLDDPGLTRRLKEARHRLAAALEGFDAQILIDSRDTREDVGTHIMTREEQVRENPRAVLTASFKRTQEALRTLEEYGKLVDVWLAGRFEVLRYDLYTLEKLTLTAMGAYRLLGDAKLMVIVGGLRTMGDLTWVVGEALAGSADVIQLREKNVPDRELIARAREVRILTAQAKARFVLNDRPDLARLAGADGVHVGQHDLAVRDTRRIVGPNLLIGVSTHDRAQLDAAILAGAGYVGVGPVFLSATKEFCGSELAGLAFVQAAAETTNIPWFAIGGITEENVQRVLDAGATRIAVSAAVVKADRPREAAARLKARLEGKEPAREGPENGDEGE
jgi:thiamine-phosphate pyrophosphorylase